MKYGFQDIWTEIKGYGDSHPGKVRDQNEDAWIFITRPNWVLAAVADGMGGHAAGEVASQLAIDTIKKWAHQTTELNTDLLRQWVRDANRRIFDKAQNDDALKHMGCTLTVAGWYHGSLHWAHVGDSRLYHFENRKLSHITLDHTLANQTGFQGGPEDHILTRAIGIKPQIEVDVGSIKIEADSAHRFLLCTDGLYDLLNDTEIKHLLHIPSMYLCAKCLVAMANDAGGRDNISVIVLDVLPASSKPDLQSEAITKEIKLTI